jgi:hypothetical protein
VIVGVGELVKIFSPDPIFHDVMDIGVLVEIAFTLRRDVARDSIPGFVARDDHRVWAG